MTGAELLEGQLDRLARVLAESNQPDRVAQARTFIPRIEHWLSQPPLAIEDNRGMFGINGWAPAIDDICRHVEAAERSRQYMREGSSRGYFDLREKIGMSAFASEPGSREPSPAVSALPRFDPSRITEAVERIQPDVLQPLVRKAADDFYGHVMEAAQDYLRDNVDFNLKSHLEMLEHQNRKMRQELYETRKMVGDPYGPHAETLQAIALLDQKAARYLALVYAVECKFDGEERHETALRYIREREAASGMSSGTAKTPQAAEGEARQPDPKGGAPTSSPTPPEVSV